MSQIAINIGNFNGSNGNINGSRDDDINSLKNNLKRHIKEMRRNSAAHSPRHNLGTGPLSPPPRKSSMFG